MVVAARHGMIQARDADPREPWLDGRNRLQDQAAETRAQDQRRPARDAECDPLYGPKRRRLADAADRFRPWQTVYWWFRRFVRRMVFQTIHDVSLMLDRARVGREARPSGGVLDSQTVKAPHAKMRGCDANKKIVGRKRHIAVDTDGRLLLVNLTTADISDSAGAQALLDAVRKRWPWLKHLFADGAYDRTKLLDKAAFRDFVLEIVRRTDNEPGFSVLPRRWVVERTFGWMTRWRRLVRDYETRIDVSEAMIHVAMGSLLLRRIAHA
jgi:putative transposase